MVKVIGYNLTLEQIGKYRKQSLTKMAKHDALMLVSRSFDGGIAYVGGICGPNAIAITGVTCLFVLIGEEFKLKWLPNSFL